MSAPGRLYVVSGPSGTGKTSLVSELAQQVKGIKVSLSYTTRPMRPNEQNGLNYQFVSEEIFQAMIAEDAFLEHAQIFSYHYGTSRKWVKDTLQKGQNVLLEIDWQGAQQIRNLFPNVSTIFIIPPSREVLLERLEGRKQDNKEVIELRMEALKQEMRHYDEYDYLICNQRFEQALEDLKLIFKADELRTAKQSETYAQELSSLLS